MNKEYIIDKWYDLLGLLSRIRRLISWSKFIWTNWDFDGHSVYDLLNFKLMKLQTELLNGYAEHDPEDLKALRIMIKLSKRIAVEYHERKYYDWHDRKWGELKCWTTPLENGNFKFNSSRPNADTPEKEQQMRDEQLAMYTKIAKWQERDEKLLFAIMQKHIRRLWD